MLISGTHTEEILHVLVRILCNLAYCIATIVNIVYIENRIKGFRAAITWLTICHLLSSSVSSPFPKPKWFRNRGKKYGNFTVLLQGHTGTWVRVTQSHKKTVKSAHDGFYMRFFSSSGDRTRFTAEWT